MPEHYQVAVLGWKEMAEAERAGLSGRVAGLDGEGLVPAEDWEGAKRAALRLESGGVKVAILRSDADPPLPRILAILAAALRLMKDNFPALLLFQFCSIALAFGASFVVRKYIFTGFFFGAFFVTFVIMVIVAGIDLLFLNGLIAATDDSVRGERGILRALKRVQTVRAWRLFLIGLGISIISIPAGFALSYSMNLILLQGQWMTPLILVSAGLAWLALVVSRCAFSLHACVIEDLGASAAMEFSWRLTENRFRGVFLLLLELFLLYTLIGQIGSFLFPVIGNAAIYLATIIQLFLAIYMVQALTVFYHDLRLRAKLASRTEPAETVLPEAQPA